MAGFWPITSDYSVSIMSSIRPIETPSTLPDPSNKTQNSLPLPSGPFDLGLALQDRTFNATTGQLIYPNPWVPEFTGETIAVNGRIWPFVNVEPRKYRFRLLDGSSARFYWLRLEDANGVAVAGTWCPGSVGKVAMCVIAGDQGFLPRPVGVDSLLMAPGERYEVVVDFAGQEGKTLFLRNNASAPFDATVALAGTDPTSYILKFKVGDKKVNDKNQIPAEFQSTDLQKVVDRLSADILRSQNPATIQKIGKYVKIRPQELAELPSNLTGTVLLLNSKPYEDPDIETKPCAGSSEIWALINLTVDTHPIHLHLVEFQPLVRCTFDLPTYNATKDLFGSLGTCSRVLPEEDGPKDTLRAPPGFVTFLAATFTPFKGRYVWHCHILDHEDNDMMRPYVIVDCPKDSHGGYEQYCKDNQFTGGYLPGFNPY
ncbi:hypothetical protein HDV00_004776 [Rhizophlyctis rosea]|nr:hypothetical protein HDV00_004776 [Rhizophlyctis rosea]